MSAPTEGSVATPQQASLAEDYIDIWFSPSTVFARRSNGGAMGPFVVTALLLIALYFAASGPLQPMFDAESARAMAEAQASNPNMTSEQLAATQKMMEGSMKYGGLVFMPIILLLLGGIIWLVAKVLGGTLSFAGGIMIASFSYLPRALDFVLVIVQSLVFDASTWSGKHQFSLGVGRFLPSDGAQGLYNFVGRIDVITIWITILIGIGLLHAAKVERTKAMLGAALVWVIGSLPAVVQIATGK